MPSETVFAEKGGKYESSQDLSHRATGDDGEPFGRRYRARRNSMVM